MMKIQSSHDFDYDRAVDLMRPAPDGSPAVTLVLPMERKGAETRKNPIVFKNALAEARRQVEERWPERSSLQHALDHPSLRQLDGAAAEFWQHQENGLILTVREAFEPLAFLLPFPVAPYVHTGPRPYLTPALRLLDSLRFSVLAIDLNQLRLFDSTEWQTAELPLEHGPHSLEDAMRYDDPERFLQFHSVSGTNLPGPGAGNVGFHGHGRTGQEVQHKKVRRFFEMVASELAANLPDPDLPVALCGPDFELGFFRQIYGQRHPQLCEEQIIVNPSSLSQDRLGELLRQWIAGRNAAARRHATRQLEEQLARKRASIDLAEVARAAVEGRIASLFLRPEYRQYGAIDEATGEATLHAEWLPGDEELVTATAVAALCSGSELRCFEPSEPLPGNAPLGAIFRY